MRKPTSAAACALCVLLLPGAAHSLPGAIPVPPPAPRAARPARRPRAPFCAQPSPPRCSTAMHPTRAAGGDQLAHARRGAAVSAAGRTRAPGGEPARLRGVGGGSAPRGPKRTVGAGGLDFGALLALRTHSGSVRRAGWARLPCLSKRQGPGVPGRAGAGVERSRRQAQPAHVLDLLFAPAAGRGHCRPVDVAGVRARVCRDDRALQESGSLSHVGRRGGGARKIAQTLLQLVGAARCMCVSAPPIAVRTCACADMHFATMCSNVPQVRHYEAIKVAVLVWLHVRLTPRPETTTLQPKP